MEACAAGHSEVVRLLLERGANINRGWGEPGAMSPLYVASLRGQAHIVSLLLASKGISPNRAVSTAPPV